MWSGSAGTGPYFACVRTEKAMGPAADEAMSEKSAAATFFPAQGSRQKPRLLPATDEALSEKSASATFFQ
jgi:hypothetical protein